MPCQISLYPTPYYEYYLYTLDDVADHLLSFAGFRLKLENGSYWYRLATMNLVNNADWLSWHIF
jgi:hypothetical protein